METSTARLLTTACGGAEPGSNNSRAALGDELAGY